MEIKNLFVDTEFTSLSNTGELLSIGIVGEHAALYVEFPENIQKVIDNPTDGNNQWLIENVINNLIMHNDPKIVNKWNISIKHLDDDHMFIYTNIDTKKRFQDVLRLLMVCECEKAGEDDFEKFSWQFVSDCCHYDAMLIFDLLMNESALDMPEHIVPSFIDLDSVLSHVCEYETITFDVSRESLVKVASQFNPKSIEDDPFYKVINSKHNALYDAVVIKYLMESIALHGMDKFLSENKYLL